MEVAQPSTFMLSSSLRSLSTDYLSLLDCGADRFADIAFCIDGRTDALVYAHRCILSARSPFFRLIFSPSSTSSASASASSSSSSSSESQSCDSPTSSSFRRPQSHSPPASSRNPYSGSISVSQCYPNQQLPTLQCQNQIVSSSTAGSSPAANSPTGILSSWEAGAAQIQGDIDVIPVDIVSYDAFVALLRFLYTGQLIIDPSAAEILGPALPLQYNLPSATANPMTYNVNYNYSVVHYGIHICLELIHAANFFGVDELSTLAQAKLGLVLQIYDGGNHASNHSISLEDIASMLIVARKYKLNRLWLSATELLVAQRDPGSSMASTNDYYYYYYYYELLQKYLPHDVLSELISSIEMLRQNHGLMNFSNGGVVGGARISSNLLNCNGADNTYYNYAYNDHHINNNVMILNSNVMQTDLNHDQYLYNKNNNDNNSNNNVMGSNNYILGSSCNNNGSLMGSQNPLNSTNMTSNRYCNRGSHEAMAMAMAETSEMMRLKQALECMDMEMVRMMAMGEGVDLNAAEALHYAVMRCSREVVKALLEMQGLVDVNHRIARRAPPSSSCSSSSSPPSGGLGSGPGPGPVGDDDMAEGKQHLGMSALHLAAMMGSADMIAVLLDHHADPTATTDDGLSPLDILRSHIQPQPQPQPTGSAHHYAHANAPNPFARPPDNNTKASRATAPAPGHHELTMPPRTTTMANPVLSKSEHKRILLCIELIQSAAAVAEREDHEPLRVHNEDDDDAEAEPAHSPISSTVTSAHHHHNHHHHAQNMANHGHGNGHLMIHDHQVALNAHQEDLMSITFSTTSNDVGINKGCVSTTSGGISYVAHHHHHHNHLPTLTGSSS